MSAPGGQPDESQDDTLVPDRMRIDVLRGDPTDHELAALMAVVSESYDAEAAAAVADDSAARTAWSLSQRSLREPLRRDVGWGRFAG